ncbi:MAG: hypothetical protein EXS31_07710 [Pedosphaera sp.]|nr:hypothetical protein [Pedosphaera sp.]
MNDGPNQTNTHSNTLTIRTVSDADYGIYKLRVSNTCGQISSSLVSLSASSNDATLIITDGGLDDGEVILPPSWKPQTTCASGSR